MLKLKKGSDKAVQKQKGSGKGQKKGIDKGQKKGSDKGQKQKKEKDAGEKQKDTKGVRIASCVIICCKNRLLF